MSDDQRNLFDPPPATYKAGTFPGSARLSRSSRAAAQTLSENVTNRQLEVLKALVVLREATADEIAQRIERQPYVVRPRVTELSIAGLITRTGDDRPTAMGATAAVYRLTTKGVEHLRQHAIDSNEVSHANTVNATDTAA